MNRLTILAAVFAVACTGFVVPTFADGGDSNGPKMKMFTWAGRYFDKDGTHPRENRRQYGKKAKDGMGRDGSVMTGQGKVPKDGQKSGKSPGRY